MAPASKASAQKGGLAKVQCMPFSLWSELKRLKTGEDILGFVSQHKDLESALRLQLRSSAARILDGRKIKNAREAMFVDGILKSAILRAAGSAKASWAPWTASGDSISYRAISSSGTVSFEEGAGQFSVPSSYSISIDSESFGRLAAATELIFDRLDPQGRKRCLRVDFVMEKADGRANWWLVDIGESNLGFVMASRLHSAAGTGMDSAGKYVDMVMGSMSGRDSVLMAYQDAKMLEGMPFEFEGLRARFESRGIRVTTLPKSGFLDMIASNPGVAHSSIALRFFRNATGDELEALRRAEEAGLHVIDSSEFIPAMQKDSISCAISNGIVPLLHGLVSIPKSKQFDISAGAQEVQCRIGSWAQSLGMEDIVLKPGTHAGSATTAFFYNVSNARHMQEMRLTVERISSAGSGTVIAEELAGNGGIDGKKLEVRVWCLREG
ncbi:MAG: hypothetical protein M1321_01205 [Candidatus Marsarchaeota archaeon]|nr:hypothetical protein [Candidatus Marsarchaeota archaeon]